MLALLVGGRNKIKQHFISINTYHLFCELHANVLSNRCIIHKINVSSSIIKTRAHSRPSHYSFICPESSYLAAMDIESELFGGASVGGDVGGAVTRRRRARWLF